VLLTGNVKQTKMNTYVKYVNFINIKPKSRLTISAQTYYFFMVNYKPLFKYNIIL